MGVRLAKRGSRQQGHEVIRAARAVISNASVWDTQRLLPTGAAPDSWRKQAMNTPQTGSFVHLHLGIPQLSSPNIRLCREHKCAQHTLAEYSQKRRKCRTGKRKISIHVGRGPSPLRLFLYFLTFTYIVQICAVRLKQL